MADVPDTLSCASRDEWRRWLHENHAASSEAWLKIRRQRARGPGISLDEAVEEALCFGWIDGLLQPIDENWYALRFSPRQADSPWSARNIGRVERLLAAGLMAPAGQTQIDLARANGQWDAALRREQVDRIPPELETALSEQPGALAAYAALPASRKKQLLYWLDSAKRPATKVKRIQAIVAELSPTD
ncbi:MAG: YdeI/OmpD-associated family protein [Ardenticatenales bacterium]|nr:YdeI/OmpD-associated family protein [Ardenticatenales bacterium]